MRENSFKDFVLDQVGPDETITCRRMFGGYGVYSDKTFFGIIHGGCLYFKVDKTSVCQYRKRGMDCFQPNAKQRLTSYFEVPPDVIEDRETLGNWSARAIEAAWASAGA